jgi:hypothetical protein
MTPQPIRSAEGTASEGPAPYMIALCMQSGNDLHAIGNGGLSSVKAPAQPHPRTAPTIYAIPELEAALGCAGPTTAAVADAQRVKTPGNADGTSERIDAAVRDRRLAVLGAMTHPDHPRPPDVQIPFDRALPDRPHRHQPARQRLLPVHNAAHLRGNCRVEAGCIPTLKRP